MESLIRHTMGPEIQVALHPHDNVWPVFCDANHMENVLLNLAINARDAMRSGGTLTIETAHVVLREADTRDWEAEPGEYVRVTVADTGTGMTPDVLEHVFEPFFTTKPDGEGTGLGLGQIYGFVRQSHGIIRLDSELGIGTEAHLYLPLIGIIFVFHLSSFIGGLYFSRTITRCKGFLEPGNRIGSGFPVCLDRYLFPHHGWQDNDTTKAQRHKGIPSNSRRT